MEERSEMMFVMVLEVLVVCWEDQCWFLLSAMMLVMMLVFVSVDVGGAVGTMRMVRRYAEQKMTTINHAKNDNNQSRKNVTLIGTAT
jgi:hypothetical protein